MPAPNSPDQDDELAPIDFLAVEFLGPVNRQVRGTEAAKLLRLSGKVDRAVIQ